jgi:hybrid cluster-associated redox disulfide protein
MEKQPFTADLSVAEVMERWPNTIKVFLKYQTACVGCEMAPFETIATAAENYNLPLCIFLADLQQAATSSPTGTSPSPAGGRGLG